MPGDPSAASVLLHGADTAGADDMRAAERQMADTKRQMAETSAASATQMRDINAQYKQDEAASRAGRRKVAAFLTKRRSFRFTGRWMPRVSRQAEAEAMPAPSSETGSAPAEAADETAPVEQR